MSLERACLDARAGQQNPSPAPAPASNPIVLAKPQPFDGTRGAAAKVFVGQIFLHVVTYPECLPTDISKVVHTDKVFNGEPVVLNEFLNNFRSSLFYNNRWHPPHQGGLAETPPDWNHVGLQAGHVLKENIQLDMVMSNAEFDSL
ncbi:uncharacterized protein VP01_10100g1, partial [Puccinia sorghi]